MGVVWVYITSSHTFQFEFEVQMIDDVWYAREGKEGKMERSRQLCEGTLRNGIVLLHYHSTAQLCLTCTTHTS